MAITRINYKTDWKMVVKNEAGWGMPFKLVFFTNSYQRGYAVSYDGLIYSNCKVLEDGDLQVAFDRPQLGQGVLQVEMAFYESDKDFADGNNAYVLPAQKVLDSQGNEYHIVLDGGTSVNVVAELPAIFVPYKAGNGVEIDGQRAVSVKAAKGGGITVKPEGVAVSEELRNEQQRLTSEVAQHGKEIEALKQVEGSQGSAIAALQAKDVAVDAEIAKLKTKDAELGKSVQQLQDQDKVMANEMETLQRKATTHDNEIAALKKEDQEADMRILLTEQKAQQHDGDIAKLQEEGIAHGEKLEELHRKDVSLDAAINWINGEIVQHQKMIAELDRENVGQTQQLVQLKAEQALLERKLADLQAWLIPTEMRVEAPKVMTWGNVEPQYLKVWMKGGRALKNVIFQTDGGSVRVDPDGRLEMVKVGTGRVWVIPTGNVEMTQQVQIRVEVPSMRKAGKDMRLLSGGGFRLT